VPGIELTTPVWTVGAIGADLGRRLGQMGLGAVGQLIAHLPSRYEREEGEAPIAELAVGTVVSARGEVTATRLAGFGRKRRFEAVLMDETGRLDLVFFNQAYLHKRIHPGQRLRVQGELRRHGELMQLANPRFELIGDDEPEAREARVRPVYPASEAVPSRQIEGAVAAVLDEALPLIEDHLSETFRHERNMPSLREAYRMVHAPADEDEPGAARRRLAYDELLLLQLGLEMRRTHLRSKLRAPALRWDEEVQQRVRARLPFELTPAQERVLGEIAGDLSGEVPTNRLIQGDVGSGKTAVALCAMLMASASGKQAALMAPTALLAEQHAASIGAMLEGSRVRVELLTGSTPAGEREALLADLDAGRIDILIGTHALLTETVRFGELGVAIIDEQHRFGVHQRARLRAKAEDEATTPHVLVMTATPIPRTLAITLFGDLDVSVIDELPPGRRGVRTRVVGRDQREKVYAFVRRLVERGGQAYVVVPTIEAEGELENLRTVLEELQSGALGGRRVAALHGRMARDERAHVMGRFRSGLIDVLVATTVIEVGVDVPNATAMVVEHADRFGLAQLHQLRGRVGRGSRASVCVLIGEPTTEEGRQRLDAMRASGDGFVLAERDFELRGPGEVFGTQQSGLAPMKVADLRRDLDLLKLARRDARAWIAASPELGRPDEALLRRRLFKAHGEDLGLGDVG